MKINLSLCLLVRLRMLLQTTPWNINDPGARIIHKKLGEMITVDSQPISIVEDSGFINFVKILSLTIKFPAESISQAMVFLRYLLVLKLSLIKGCILLQVILKHYCFTTDIWTMPELDF